MRELDVDFAQLTPTVSRLVRPRDVPNLNTLNLTGEPVEAADVVQWKGIDVLRNLYGPAEVSVFATVNQIEHQQRAVRPNIGKGAGVATWIVRTDSPDHLCAVGDVGELWLEGPLVSSGYLDDEEKSAAVFVQDPPWLLHGGPGFTGRRGRLYRTGDLVRYANDGSGRLEILGRQDAEIKLHGQRIQPGEVEYQIQQCLPEDMEMQIAVDVLTLQGRDSPTLVAFASLAETDGRGPQDSDQLLQGLATTINAVLAEKVPSFMIPTYYISVRPCLPMTGTGKTDRRRLREIGATMTQERLTSPLRPPRRKLSTRIELEVSELWAAILGITASSIGADDSFLRLGGDSVSAMRLVTAARANGLAITVMDVFRHPRLRELATLVQKVDKKLPDDIRPFSLIPQSTDPSEIRESAATLCNVNSAQVEDVYPCTPLQEGLLAMSARRVGDYIAKIKLQIRPGVDVTRLQGAWQQVVANIPIMRTRIVDLPNHGLFQVVIEEVEALRSQEVNYSSTETRGFDPAFGLGTSLVQATLLCDRARGRNTFALAIHHSIYDGWSMPMYFEALTEVFEERSNILRHLTPYNRFIEYVGGMDPVAASTFWQAECSNLESSQFPSLPSTAYRPLANQSLNYTIEGLTLSRITDFTASTTIRAALALLIAIHTGEYSEALFGAVVSGRQADVAGIEMMAGPTIATVPLRIVIDPSEPVQLLLKRVQEQASRMTAFEQAGLQNIRQYSEDTGRACKFQTLLIVQPPRAKHNTSPVFEDDDFNPNPQSNLTPTPDEVDVFTTHAIVIHCHLASDRLRLHVSFDSHVVSSTEMLRLVEQFEAVLRQLCTLDMTETSTSDISTVSQQDIHDIWRWNSVRNVYCHLFFRRMLIYAIQLVPEPVKACVHDIIGETARRQPNAPAVCAWDGDLTYRQLDQYSTWLAESLVGLKVANTVVPLCFEKSMWTPVAIMAVMKSGGACVALDPTNQPRERLRAIIEQVRPTVVISSMAQRGMVTQLSTSPVLVVSQEHLDEYGADYSSAALPSVEPTSTLYVVFTSGSTGQYKQKAEPDV